MSNPFEIRYTNDATADLKTLRAYDLRKVLDGIEAHLSFQPTQESKSRIKAMTEPFWSQYRLRIDDFRVYYDVSETARTVYVLRILQKITESTPKESP